MLSQRRSEQSQSGARYVSARKKKLSELGGYPVMTKLGERRIRADRGPGGNHKLRLLNGNTANVYNPKTKKNTVAAIKTITDNPANRNFIRRNIITKGTIIETEAGKARVTSRPGQQGTVNAVLI